MKYVLGYRVTTSKGLDVFYQRPDHATYVIQQVLEKIPPNCIMYKEGIYVIEVCYHPAQCPGHVVLYEVSQQTVFTVMWSPQSPNKLEEDHQKVKRFTVRGWYWTKEAAQAEVDIFAEKHNYTDWAKPQ